VVEAGAMGEEVVDLAGLHVVGKAGDEEGEDALPLRARVRRRRRVHVVGVPRRSGVGQAVGEAHLVAGRLGSLDLDLARQHGRGAARLPLLAFAAEPPRARAGSVAGGIPRRGYRPPDNVAMVRGGRGSIHLDWSIWFGSGGSSQLLLFGLVDDIISSGLFKFKFNYLNMNLII
jgi:hypothetical protein